MKASEMRTKSPAEITRFVTETEAALAQAHTDMKTKEVKNVRVIRGLKKQIARALTIQSETELAELEKNND